MSVHTMSEITEDGSHSMDSVMRRLYDPAFKLFGRTIPVSSDSKDAASGGQERGLTSVETSSVQRMDGTPDSEDESCVPDEVGSSSAGSNEGCEDEIKVELVSGKLEGSVMVREANPSSEVRRSDCAVTPEDEGKEVVNVDQAPKKPDKPVHCPRCKSLDTKFCYYNNYNVNQPRHFCKNCQRYWTAGGTLRNVPVGAGRRKNKHAGALPRAMLPDGAMVRSDPPDNAQHLLSANPAASPGGLNRPIMAGLPSRNLLPLEVQNLTRLESPASSAVLNFRQESPVRTSMVTAPLTPCKVEVLQGYKPAMSQTQAKRHSNINESPLPMGMHMDHVACDVKPSRELNVSSNVANEFGASVLRPVGEKPTEFSQPEVHITSNPTKPEAGGESDMPKYADAALAAWASSAPFSFMASPWQYAANLGGWGNAFPPAMLANMAQGASVSTVPALANLAQGAMGVDGTQLAQAATAGLQPPGMAAMGAWAGGIPWPLMQNPLWGPSGWGGSWTVPWVAPFAAAAAVAAAAAATAAASTPDLRNTVLGKHPREQGEVDNEKVLVPKTLRIDDPGEAARSSIWSTLGIGRRSDTLAAGGIFGDFKSKAESRKDNDLNARTRSSNPAGRDRSLLFQENSGVSAASALEGAEK